MNSSVLPEVRKYGRRTRSSTSNVNKYIIKKCKTTTYQNSFLIRTSGIWNCLVYELDFSSSTLASFKSVIFNYYKSALAVPYDCKDPRSFKSICLKFKITCFIFFQACERAESSKSCNLIGSESWRYFTILPANPGGIVGSFIHKFVGCL